MEFLVTAMMIATPLLVIAVGFLLNLPTRSILRRFGIAGSVAYFCSVAVFLMVALGMFLSEMDLVLQSSVSFIAVGWVLFTALSGLAFLGVFVIFTILFVLVHVKRKKRQVMPPALPT